MGLAVARGALVGSKIARQFHPQHPTRGCCQEALDNFTPMGKAMFTIIGAMAELEPNVIHARVMAGLEYARQHGTKSGKAVGRPNASSTALRWSGCGNPGCLLRGSPARWGLALVHLLE